MSSFDSEKILVSDEMSGPSIDHGEIHQAIRRKIGELETSPRRDGDLKEKVARMRRNREKGERHQDTGATRKVIGDVVKEEEIP